MKIELLNLKKSHKEHECLFEDNHKSTDKKLKIRTTDGWRTIDSPYDPENEANQVLNANLDSPGAVILVGAGSGYLIKEVLKRGIKDITLITPYRVIAEKNAEILSDYKHIDGNSVLIVADSFDGRLKKIINQLFERHQKISMIFHPRETKTYPELFNPLSVYLETLNEPVEICCTEKKIKRVLFPCSGQIIEKEIINEFKKRGVEVFDIDSFNGKRLDHKKAWKIINEYKPDLIMSTNNKGSDIEGFIPTACFFSGVKWATWFLDDPRFIVSKNEIFSPQNRHGFCWDVSGTEALNDMNFSNAALLPLATDPEMFYPGKGDESLAGRIIYVGSLEISSAERSA